MRKLETLLFMLAVQVVLVFGQDARFATVSGFVYDASDGEALIGANVFVAGTTVGSSTDRNSRDFQSTHETLQGIDGNYHEGAFHLDGEGVGVFGSAAVDTAYFEVTRL